MAAIADGVGLLQKDWYEKKTHSNEKNRGVREAIEVHDSIVFMTRARRASGAE
jgi:hypothetical protein